MLASYIINICAEQVKPLDRHGKPKRVVRVSWEHLEEEPVWRDFHSHLQRRLCGVWAHRWSKPHCIACWGWLMLLGKGMSGAPCWNCCHCNSTPDKWMQMDGCMFRIAQNTQNAVGSLMFSPLYLQVTWRLSWLCAVWDRDICSQHCPGLCAVWNVGISLALPKLQGPGHLRWVVDTSPGCLQSKSKNWSGLD